MAENGYFIIADITGYTQFMTHSELEHAQGILSSLFQVMLDNITPPMKISNFQGDAILSYVPESQVQQGQTLLETVEAIYFAFRRTLTNMTYNTTCTCTACRNMPDLDLKFFIHYGQYTLQKLRDREELSGPDVILAHRLMKNKVTETTTRRAYVLLTEQAITAMNLQVYAERSMIAHHETYEHLGEIPLYVRCLHEAWEQWQSEQQIVASSEERFLTLEGDLPVPPPVAWEYLHDPTQKLRWLNAHGLKEVRPLGFKLVRMGVGGEQHCLHGDNETLIWKYVSWRPFEYSTFDYVMPLEGRWRHTEYISPNPDGGSHVVWDVEKPVAPDKARTVMLRTMMSGMMDTYEQSLMRNLEAMQQIIQEDLASGALVLDGGQTVEAGKLVSAATADIPTE